MNTPTVTPIETSFDSLNPGSSSPSAPDHLKEAGRTPSDVMNNCYTFTSEYVRDDHTLEDADGLLEMVGHVIGYCNCDAPHVRPETAAATILGVTATLGVVFGPEVAIKTVGFALNAFGIPLSTSSFARD